MCCLPLGLIFSWIFRDIQPTCPQSGSFCTPVRLSKAISVSDNFYFNQCHNYNVKMFSFQTWPYIMTMNSLLPSPLFPDFWVIESPLFSDPKFDPFPAPGSRHIIQWESLLKKQNSGEQKQRMKNLKDLVRYKL